MKHELERCISKNKINGEFSIAIASGCEKDNINDIQTIVLTTDNLVFADHIDVSIERVLLQCGWYAGDKATDGRIVEISLEPRYPIVNDRVGSFSAWTISHIKTFYHVTFKKYAEKILRNGLQPSFTRRGEFYHPERIYLFGDKTTAIHFLEHQELDYDLQSRVNTRKIGNSGRTADIKYQNGVSKGMVLLKVNLKQMLNDGKLAKLYHDNRWDADSLVFFTQTSINPKYIEIA